MDSPDQVTRWLQEWQAGNPSARDRVFARLYDELRRLAASLLRSEAGHATLQPTALLHDALMKLIQARAPQAEDRGHFVRIVARAMRQILIDRARRQLADKRGAGERPVPLDAVELPWGTSPAELVAVDDALASLARLDERAAAVVELRVFGGLTIDETAAALELHPSAVNREWAHACAWLKQHAFVR